MAAETETQAREIIKLNIGGTIFVTTFGTLTKKSKYFSALLTTPMQVDRDSEGNIFIDREGRLFDPILYFMRQGVWRVSPDLEMQRS